MRTQALSEFTDINLRDAVRAHYMRVGVLSALDDAVYDDEHAGPSCLRLDMMTRSERVGLAAHLSAP